MEIINQPSTNQPSCDETLSQEVNKNLVGFFEVLIKIDKRLQKEQQEKENHD